MKKIITLLLIIVCTAVLADTLTPTVTIPFSDEQSALAMISPNFTSVNLILSVLGFVVYFFGYFIAYNKSSAFSILVWFKENWYNIPATLAAMAIYYIMSDSITKIEAAFIGLAPNLILDWAMKFRETRNV